MNVKMVDRSKCPELRSFEDLRFDYPSHVTLSNGIPLYVVDNGDQEVNKLEIICRGGLLDEEKPLQAMALASMLVHGSDEYSSSDVAEILDYNGSYMNAVSQDNFIHVSISSLNKNFGEVLPVFSSIVQRPSIPEREFEVLKTQVKGAYKTACEKVKYLSQMACRGLYFGENHPFSHIICDEDVDCLSVEDVKRFHARYFKPENYVMILSGKIGEKEKRLVDEYFGGEKIGGKQALLCAVERNSSSDKEVMVNKDGALQSAVYMIQEAVPRSHPDYIKLRILITALGGYFGSRLMQNIREEKGYTYGINAMLVGRRCGAKIVITSECDTEYTYPLISEVKKEIRRLQDELMDTEEIDTVKNCMLSDLAKTLDSPFSMASCVSSNILYATGEDYFNRQVKDIMDVTPEELRRIAKTYLNTDKFYTAIAGDEKQLKLYGE